jgi:hypothetical protein
MKITSEQLEQLIKEEVARQLEEASLAQKIGSFFTGEPTDDDILEAAANEIMYQIDRNPPVWRELYDNTFMSHRANPKALRMALEDKVMKMPVTLRTARKHGIEPGNLRKMVRLMMNDLLDFLKKVHETRMNHMTDFG